MRMTVAPDGKGSAAQWVESQFHEFVKRARSKSYQRRLGFLCVIDGDHEGFSPRKARLSESRADAARIAIWVPTWSIETWVWWLSSRDGIVDDSFERRSLRDRVTPRWSRLLPIAADRFLEIDEREEELAPSLTDARSELRRLPM
ncbi:MAG: hypothetical protein AAF658_02020 [Myxococcota bacterium]